MMSRMKVSFLWMFMGLLMGTFWNCSDQKTQQKEPNNNLQKIVRFNANINILPDSAAGITTPKAVSNKPQHADMILINGGSTLIGSATGLPQEQPTFWASVKPFLMDVHPVTVAQFRQFVKATAYKTEAEKFGDAGVFDEQTQAWTLKKGANWQYPQGLDQPAALGNHPVVQVSWNDAAAYAKWAGKRLPTEIEWEHAARNARNDRNIYPFGNDITDAQKKYRANVWQEDGYRFTSPVGAFGKTPIGLTDMTGNVWEWCEDWKSDYATWIKGEKPTVEQEKAQRGGSFLCEPGWCHGYRVSGRSFSTPETSLMHVGFRCVKDL
jgi:formylglycine-generating enzyme